MKKPVRSKKSVDSYYAGSEPILTEVKGRNDPNLRHALNWYNYIHDISSAKNWLLQWMKLNSYDRVSIETLRSISDRKVITTPGWVCKIALNGAKLAEDNIQYVKDKISEMIESSKKKYDEEETSDIVTTKKVDLQSRTLQKNKSIHTSAEEEVIDGSLSMYDFLKKYTVTPAAANYLKAKYLPCFEEMFCDDPQVKEAYGKSFKKWQNFYKTLIEDLDRYIGNKKAVKVSKPKIVKEKPLTKIVEKVQYQKEFPPLKIVSILPQEILSAQSLWTYNTKYKQLTVYHAQGPSGFGIKGTTLTGFDESKSVTKALRKPEIQIKEVLEAGKVAIRKVMDNIKTSTKVPNGRINENTILLRVIR